MKEITIKELRLEDWILYGEKKEIGKVVKIIKDAKISDRKALSNNSEINLTFKNFNAVGVKEKRGYTWFRLDDVPTQKILGRKQAGELKTDLAIRRYIKLKGLDK